MMSSTTFPRQLAYAAQPWNMLFTRFLLGCGETLFA